MPRFLDLYCGAGLAADGYAAAGWEVIGVDNVDQPEYPYEFFRGDALDWLTHSALWSAFDAIDASPPCQAHTRASKLRDAQGGVSRYDDLLTPTLELIRKIDLPWVVENVPDAKHLMLPRTGETLTTLCGSMFPGLKVQRHRHFLSNRRLVAPHACDHSVFDVDPITGKPRPWGVYHVPSDNIPQGGRTCRDAAHAAECMGVERGVSWVGLKEGFPPAYSEWIGRQLLATLTPVSQST